MALVPVFQTTTLPRPASTLSLRTKFVVWSCNLQLQSQPDDSRKILPSITLFHSLFHFYPRNNNYERVYQNVIILQLVLEVKEKLEKEYHSLSVGKNGRDDEDMILRFLKDRKFSIEKVVSKLTKAIKWHCDFEVFKLSEEAIKDISQTGKAYVHDFLDINNRPVLVVVASKHFPKEQDPADDERLCVYLIEKALSKLLPREEQILGILDLKGFGKENTDLKYLKFLFDVFYYYYLKRLSQVLFVDAPFVFKQFWRLIKPLLKSYASQVRFCSFETVRMECVTDETLPPNFRE